mgnify:CR=1 FL=1
MKKALTWIIVIGVIGLFGAWMAKGYNKMVVEEENVERAWGQVEAQYQRRFDLIPGLQEAAATEARFEKSTFVGIAEARSKVSQIVIDPSNMTEEQLAQWQSAQGEVSSAFSRLIASFEAYPELKANEAFRDFMKQYEGTENRIAVARIEFNEHAQSYNTLIRRFPNNIVAGIFGFTKKPYFKSEEGAEKGVKVNFGEI